VIVADQAEQLRRMVREMRRHARVVAVTGGKGGTGKTNVAVNLAILLARCHRQKVMLVDADLGLANVDLLLDVQPRWNLCHVIDGLRRVEETIIVGPEGVEIVPGASGIARLANLEEVQRRSLAEQLARLERRADFLIVDTSAGIGDTVVTLASSADDCLVVTTPEPPSIADAYALVKLVARRPQRPRVSLLVNMAGSRQEARRVFERLSAVAARFAGITVHDAGFIFCDGHVTRAVRRRRPFVTEFPNAQATWCVRQVADRLLDGAAQAAAPAAADGFFRRVAGLIGALTS